MAITTEQTKTPVIEQEEATELQPAEPPRSPATTPQEFFAEVTERVDVRVILEELATG